MLSRAFRGAIWVAVSLMLAPPVLAERLPGVSSHDKRVRVAKYTDGQVYKVRTSLTRATVVEFEAGERIAAIVAGDTESYKFESIPGDRVFAIKPTGHGARTNVTVYTDRRSYYFVLEEGNNAFYAVRFKYPERARNTAGRPVSRQVQNYNYGVSAATTITPRSIWDDGVYTYFKFGPEHPIPAIFKVSDGFERTVNSQVEGHNTIRVSGTSLQWALRLGELEVCVVEMFDDK